jgi:hypothetical protein
VTQNPNRANGRFRPLRKLLRGHRSNLSRNKAFGTANSFKVHHKREEIWGGLLPFSTEPGALDGVSLETHTVLRNSTDG